MFPIPTGSCWYSEVKLWLMRMHVPWRAVVAVINDGLWSILQNPSVMKTPLMACGGTTTPISS